MLCANELSFTAPSCPTSRALDIWDSHDLDGIFAAKSVTKDATVGWNFTSVENNFAKI